MHFCFDAFCFGVFLCWGASVGIVSVLFLSSTGQLRACSVCSKNVEAKQNTWVRFLQWSVLLAGFFINKSVSFLPYCPDPVIALKFKNQIPYLNKIKASYLILLIFQFWWRGEKCKSQSSPLGSFNFLKSLKVTVNTVIAYSSRNISWNTHFSVTTSMQILSLLFLPLSIYIS